MEKVARLAIAAPRRAVVVALLVMVGAGIFGVLCVKNLSSGGSRDPGSESAQAAALLTKKFHRTDSEMLITVSAQDNVGSEPVRVVGADIAQQLKSSSHVAHVASPWDKPPQVDTSLISKDAPPRHASRRPQRPAITAGPVRGTSRYQCPHWLNVPVVPARPR